VEEGQRITQPLRELSTPLLDLSGPAPWAAVQSAFDPFFPKGGRLYYFKSRYLKNLDGSTIDALYDRAVNPPAPFVLIVLWHFGGAMRRANGSGTAFMGRDAPYLFSVDAIWDDPSQNDEVIAYSREFLAAMEPYSPGGLYVNFAGFGEEGEKLVRDAYGTHYDRLVTLKNQYDPTNLFRLNQNIKPTV
jgi:FAD/FMN-containing dehydrogenase